MIAKYKFIHFVTAGDGNEIVNGKPAFECRNNKTKSILAIIFWHPEWEEYCFTQFEQNVIFNKSCLNDIQNFMEKI